MKSILTRKISILGGVVGVLLISSAIGVVANSSHGNRSIRIESASTQTAMPLVSPTHTPAAEPAEPAENEPAENEPAENEPVENDNHEQPAPPPATSAPASSTRTFSLVGGTVVITCTGNVSSIGSATPNAGFTTESEQSEGGQVEVRFRSDSHESRLEVSCQNGTIVVQEMREEAS